MLLGKTVAYNSLLHDNTVNYTRPHVLHMPYARSHPDAIAPSLSLPLLPFFPKTQLMSVSVSSDILSSQQPLYCQADTVL